MRLLRRIKNYGKSFLFVTTVFVGIFGAHAADAATMLSNISESNNQGTSIFRSNIWVAYKFTAGASATISSVTLDLDHTAGNYTGFSTYTSGVIRFYNDNSGVVGTAISGTLAYTSTNTGTGVTVYGTAGGGTITIPSAGNYWMALTCASCANIDYQESSSTGYTGSTSWATVISSTGISTSNNSGSSWGTPYSSITYGAVMFTIAGTLADSTAPTITSISSDKTNNSYTSGEVIDIDVTFSEAVTSTGNVTVTLETGATDRTCTFTVTSSTTGTCNYTVQTGDTSSDLTVSTISGTIDDAAGNDMTNFVPATNLASNKALVIDTSAPTLAEVTAITTPTNNSTPQYTFSTDEAGTITYGGTCSSATTSATSGNNTITLATLPDGTYTDCTITITDSLSNASSALTLSTFTINTVVAASSSNDGGGEGGGGKGGEPASLPDSTTTLTTSGRETQKSIKKREVNPGEPFTLSIKAPDADSVKNITVKIAGKTHVLNPNDSENNPLFLTNIAILKAGTYPYSTIINYGSFEKRMSGIVVVKEKDAPSIESVPVLEDTEDTQTPAPLARIFTTPRTTFSPTQNIPEPQIISPIPSETSSPIITEKHVAATQQKTLLNRAISLPRTFIGKITTSSKNFRVRFRNMWLSYMSNAQDKSSN
ncbi:MAG: hypothetical protein AAB649_05145 [Patescibacteria group bacterium]